MALKQYKFKDTDNTLFEDVWEIACRVLAWKGREELKLSDKIITRLEGVSVMDQEEKLLPGMDKRIDPDTNKLVAVDPKESPEVPRCRHLEIPEGEIEVSLMFYQAEIDFFNKCLDQASGGLAAGRQAIKVVNWLDSGVEVDPKDLKK